MKLIDADALLAGIYSDNPSDIMLYIANQPEAVVRCEGCKYRDTIPKFSNWLLEGCRWANGESPDDDDFCSYGKRKEE